MHMTACTHYLETILYGPINFLSDSAPPPLAITVVHEKLITLSSPSFHPDAFLAQSLRKPRKAP